MQKTPSQVTLLTGPGGSGKTAMASRIADSSDWVHTSEDLLWDEFDHAPQKGRTDEKQARIPCLAHHYLLQAVRHGKNAVFLWHRFCRVC